MHTGSIRPSWHAMPKSQPQAERPESGLPQRPVHPAARLVGDAEIKLIAVEDRLGLNPQTRLRLGISAVEHKTKLDAFLEGK